MKTNSAARRVWKLRLSFACLTIAVLASFDLWAGGYCYRNLARTSLQQTGTPPILDGNAIGFGVSL